jgi:hypothetical protein
LDELDEEFLRLYLAIRKNVEVAAKTLLQGDREAVPLISFPAYLDTICAYFSNALAGASTLIGGSIYEGQEVLSKVFATRKWYVPYYKAIKRSADSNLLPRVVKYYNGIALFPAYCYVDVLDSLLVSSAVYRATRSTPIDLEFLYNYFVEKELYDKLNDPLLLLSSLRPEGIIKEISLPFLSHIYPFISSFSVSEEDVEFDVKAEDPKERKRLLWAAAHYPGLPVHFVLMLFHVIHNWNLWRQHVHKMQTVEELKEVLKRAQRAHTADYKPYWSLETMSRHTYLFVGAMLFKVTNYVFRLAGKPEMVFEPTGDFEKDLRQLWEMASPEGHSILKSWHGIEDVDQLMGLVERWSYDLFVNVQRTPFEWIGINILNSCWESE